MYHIKIITIFILLLSSLYKDTVQAQDSLIVDKSLWRAGMSLVPAMYIHSATMKGFEGIPSCCPQYSSGNGFWVLWGLILLMIFPILDMLYKEE